MTVELCRTRNSRRSPSAVVTVYDPRWPSSGRRARLIEYRYAGVVRLAGLVPTPWRAPTWGNGLRPAHSMAPRRLCERVGSLHARYAPGSVTGVSSPRSCSWSQVPLGNGFPGWRTPVKSPLIAGS